MLVVVHWATYLETCTKENKITPTYMWPCIGLLTLQLTYKSINNFFKEFDSKKGFPFAGRYLNGERERACESGCNSGRDARAK
jgi:hypothetical protein